MGAIKPTELANGNIGLEITYGGKEVPFGGVDTSAPPAYIDPRCFAAVDGFVVVDNKLVCVNFSSFAVPTLWDGTSGVQLLGFGNFYTQTYGTLNYALGYKTATVTGPPSGVTYTFYMTAWLPNDISTLYNDVLTYNLYNASTPSTNASVTLQLLTQGASPIGSGASVSITGTTTQNIAATGGTPSYTLPGVVSTVAISGGTGYSSTSGSNMYYLVQGGNLTAQIEITSVDSGGGITGVSIQNSFNIVFGGETYNVAGAYYSIGTATLLPLDAACDVVLKIVGPGGTNTYTVPVQAANTGLPVPAGSGATTTITAGGGGDLLQFSGTGGNGYTAGAFYTVEDTAGGSGALVYVTSVGTGGSLEGLASSIYTIQSGTGYVNNSTTGTLSPVAVSSLVAAPTDILTYMAELINGDIVGTVADPNVTASVNSGTGSLTLTAILAGTIGNTISVQDESDIIATPDLFYYYFPCRTAVYLSGGTNGSSTGLPTVLNPQSSITSVGGTLYIGNIGPAIIKYSGPGQFALSSIYEGVRVLRKFAGSLIGLGVIPAPGVVVQSQDMIFLWSATDDLDIWNPVNASGNVTGAGFEQLADIGEYLTGLIVTNGTAFIIRARGISYATPTGNGTDPFNVNHVSLGLEGEGSQLAQLVCQYDQTGVFAGNSDIFSVSSSITPIGAKVKQLLFQLLNNAQIIEYAIFSSAACSVGIVDEFPLACLLIGNTFFLFNPQNGTWVTLTGDYSLDGSAVTLGVFANQNSSATDNEYSQAQLTMSYETEPGQYEFFNLVEGVPDINSISNPATVTFPVEEIAFGRDVTVDSLYMALWGNVTENVTITFYVTVMQNSVTAGQPAVYTPVKITYATLILTPAQFNSLSGSPIELQLFATAQGAGAVTGHSPQLSFEIESLGDSGTAQIRFSKLLMLCSYDSKQRPA